MGIHQIEGHLNGIKLNASFGCNFEHAQVDQRILVTGEADEAKLARLARVFERGLCTVFIEDTEGVFVADDFVMLNEVDAVCFEAGEAFVELTGSLFVGTAVYLGHQEGFLPVAIAQGLAHAGFAEAAVVIPTVVEEVHAAIEGSADEAQGERFVDVLEAEVPASEADGGNLFAGSAEWPLRHVRVAGSHVQEIAHFGQARRVLL